MCVTEEEIQEAIGTRKLNLTEPMEIVPPGTDGNY